MFSIRSQQSCSRGTSKDDRGYHECSWNNRRVHHHCHLEHWPHSKTSQKSKSKKHSHSGSSIFSIVRGQEEAKGQSCSNQGEQKATSLKNVGEEVNICSNSGCSNGHCERSINILKMSSNLRLK